METDDLTYYDYLSSATESGKFIYLMLEAFPQGIIISDAADKIIYANFKMAQLTGYSRKEMLGKVAAAFLHLPEQQLLLKNIVEQRSAGNYESYELFIKRRVGTPFLGHIITAPYKNIGGEITGTISIITDITVTKRVAELEALAIGATKALNSVIVSDKFGKIEWVNEGFTRLSGYYLHEVIDTKGEVLRKNMDEFESKFKEAVSLKKPMAGEFVNFNKSGMEYKVKVTFTPVLDIQGDVKDMIIIETDIT
jgi:PAS domain S-box-containing protein